jgi:hypothetical protein
MEPMRCALCGHEFEPNAQTCAGCPLAAVQGCNLVCCPNCGYQVVDERQSSLVQWLRRVWKPAAAAAPARVAEGKVQ